ncbi:MAG: right-handed parallel beta-helix repeat-containing protein, partial [Phycisphaeraceae bacterium]
YGESGHVVGNRVFGNQGEGIATRYDVDVRRNQVYTNQHGIAVSGSSSFPFSGEISNNVVYDNLDSGISVAHLDEAAVLNNTIYQQVGVGVRLTEEATDFQLRNNIIWVDLGTALRVDSDTQPAFDSDYNLFWTGDVDPDGVDAVLWGTTELATLSDWQTATGQDLGSFDADPLFVDIDGPDDVLGFNEIVDQQLVDGGADDNFQLLPDSPGIDRGDTYLGTLDDYHGRPRHDDPGTPNGGSRIFNESLGATGNFAEVGTLLSTSSPEYYELPFTFEFYGQEFDALRMNRDGVLQFDSSRSDMFGVDITAENLHNALRIAPFWAEMSTYSSEHEGVGIFIEEGTDFVTFRWRAVADADDGIVNFSVTLHEDGRIDFDYGEITSDVVPVIGL